VSELERTHRRSEGSRRIHLGKVFGGLSEEVFRRSKEEGRESASRAEHLQSLVVRREDEDEDVKSSMRMRKVKGGAGDIEHEHSARTFERGASFSETGFERFTPAPSLLPLYLLALKVAGSAATQFEDSRKLPLGDFPLFDPVLVAPFIADTFRRFTDFLKSFRAHRKKGSERT
jgi:hypothetical protein